MMTPSVICAATPGATRRYVMMISQIIGSIVLVGGLLTGCVSSEKYEAEKARALNFQRLLAQEEKRTGEINVKYQEAQREFTNLESQNRDLTTELDALRDQLTSTKDELTRLRGGESGGSASDGASDLTMAEPSISEFGLEDIEFKDSDLADIGVDLKDDPLMASTDSMMASADSMATGLMGGDGTTHTVSKGETLYRISREYGVTVRNLKDWNNLVGNLITPGQKLIVGK